MTEVFQLPFEPDRRARQASEWFIVILLAIALEGGVRKWLLPAELHPLAYASKDILALGFILRFGLPCRYKILSRLRDWMLIVACFLLPCFLLGLTWSVVAAVMIFKNAVLWPLFAIYMSAWLDWKSLVTVTRALCLLCVSMAALGFVQFYSPVSASINKYAWHVMGRMERIATFGVSAGVRATGTFSYITGYATFASVGFLWMVWRMLNSRSRVERLVCIGGAISCLVCILTSGSRAPLYQCILGLMTAVTVSSQIRHKLRAFVLCISVLVAYAALSDRQFITSFYGRLTAAGDSVTERVTGGGLEFIRLMLDHPFGVGMGQESNVKDYRVAEQATTIEFIEDGRSRMAIEGGVLAVLAQVITSAIFLQILGMSWRTRNDQSKIAAAAMLPAALYLLTNCLWYDHNASALWWFFIGAWLAVTMRVAQPAGTCLKPSVSRSCSRATGNGQPSVWQSELI